MSIFKTPWAALILASFVATGAGCMDMAEEDDDSSSAKSGDDIDAYLRSLDYLEQAPPQPKTQIDCEGTCPPDGEEVPGYYCTYDRYTETIRYDRFVAFQPNSATLWPGVVVHGHAAQFGHLNPLSAKLGPSTFSISLENIASSPVGHMPDPSLSAFREARNAILAQGVTGATAASIDFEIIQVHSESQVAVALGAGIDWPGAGAVAGSFDFSSSEKRTKVLVNFTQAYYTVDVDAPYQPSRFFHWSVDLDDIKNEATPGDPPLYVQSITYGRRVLFSIESSEDADTVSAALEATLSKAVSVNATVEAKHQSVLQQSTIRAFVIGGAGGQATGVVNGFEGMVDFIVLGGDYSAESPGAPVAYKLAYLDNTSAQLSFTTEYNERKCERTSADMRVELLGIKHISGGETSGTLEIYGDVWMRLPTENSNVVNCNSGGVKRTLWSVPKGSWVGIEKGAFWTPTAPTYIFQENVSVMKDKRICLAGDLWESDVWSDDDMGYGDLMMLAQEGWEGDFVIQVRGAGNHAMDVHVRMTFQ
jgi:thiol-activated cytolysin